MTGSAHEKQFGVTGPGLHGRHEMPRRNRLRRWLASVGLATVTGLAGLAATSPAVAGPPSPADNIDYAASGFMLPKGAVVPAAWTGPAAGGPGASVGMPGAQPIPSTMPYGPMMGGPMMGGPMMGGPMMGGQVMSGPSMGGAAMRSLPMTQSLNGGYGIAPVGYQMGMMGCDAGPSYGGGYSGCCDAGSCDGTCGCAGGGCQFEGILPSLMGSNCECAACMSGAVSSCLGQGGVLGSIRSGECGESDFGILAGTIGGGLLGLAEKLRPFSEGGRCAQRWFDFSVEGLFLTQNISGPGGSAILTNRGNGVDGVPTNPELSIGSADGGGLEAGVRLSAAMIAGAGGSLEATYMGGNSWSGNGSVTRMPGETRLTSFASGFGAFPENGFANTRDFQSVNTDADFHSFELNYRRRTVGPYCKFQGSWLAGLRYLRYDNGLDFFAFGDTPGITSFAQAYDIDNRMLGAQIGFDFWWNVAPGIQFGVEGKTALMQNDWVRTSSYEFTSGTALNGDSVDDFGQDTTLIGDLTATLVYRFDYSWSFRSSYHLIGIDDVILPTIDNTSTLAFLTNDTPPPPTESSVTLQGFTLGLEYLW